MSRPAVDIAPDESSWTAISPPDGRGPGILLVQVADMPSLAERAAYLASEGYLVLPVVLGKGTEVVRAVERMSSHPGRLGKVAAIAHGAACKDVVDAALQGQFSAVILYDPGADIDAVRIASLPCPAALHFGVSGLPDSTGFTAVKQAAAQHPAKLQLFLYRDAEPGFADPGSPHWNAYVAGIAYSRSLALLRRELGPHYNLSDLWDHHLECEFVLKDATANMRTMVPQPYVNHVPTMTGGVGHDLLKRFYTHHFIEQSPPDRKAIPISRTIGADRVIEEKVFCFTHTIEMDWMLPGIKPTGKYVEIPLIVVITFQGDKLYNEHIYWDQASVLVQLGLIDPKGLPVAGMEQARKLLDKTLPSNTLMENWSSSAGKPV